MSNTTIFSLSSAPGRAGVAVFRVSGPKAGEIAKALSGATLPKPRLAKLFQFKDADGQPIDEGLLLWMPAPNSFTGEDCAEFQTHGSPAVAEALASAFLVAGAQQAAPGEFTRRACMNGKLDLTEAEGLADLIDADTQAQRIQALRQMQGGLKARYEGWREGVLDALAQIEGEIDFPDEADVPDDLSHKASAPLIALIKDMDRALSEFERGERIRAGIEVAIIGAPNAGKSSLINYLAGRDAAIVTDQAGTTRDIIEISLVIDGLAVRLSDTAGLRDSDDVIEVEGIKRARERAESADIRILVKDLLEPSTEGVNLIQEGDLILLNKQDKVANAKAPIEGTANNFAVSLTKKTGLKAFEDRLVDIIRERYSPGRDAGLTRARHKDCVSHTKNSLIRAEAALVLSPELAGDDLRSALQALRELAGETDIEAVFDRIFSRFCVGK
jgi:tRNA modification GTPase